MIKNTDRDAKAKQALIRYFVENPQERLFQSITNFMQAPYIGVANTPDGKDFRDLWHLEADRIVSEAKAQERLDNAKEGVIVS